MPIQNIEEMQVSRAYCSRGTKTHNFFCDQYTEFRLPTCAQTIYIAQDRCPHPAQKRISPFSNPVR